MLPELDKCKHDIVKLKSEIKEKDSLLQSMNENLVKVYDEQQDSTDCREKCINDLKVLKIVNENLLQHNNELKNIIDGLKDLNNCLKENNDLLKENNVLLKVKSTSEKEIAPVWCNHQPYKRVQLHKHVNKNNDPNILINTNNNNKSSDTALSYIKNLVNKKKDIHINKIFKTKKK